MAATSLPERFTGEGRQRGPSNTQGSGLFNMTVDYVGGAQPMEALLLVAPFYLFRIGSMLSFRQDAHASDHSDGEHSSEHEAEMPMDDGSHAAGLLC